MRSRSQRLTIARATVALLLFAQAALAWSACEWLERSPGRAVRAAGVDAPCHEANQGAACLSHCLADRQAAQKVVFDFPAAPPAPGLLAGAPLEPALHADLARSLDSARGSGPPKRIRFQSLQL